MRHYSFHGEIFFSFLFSIIFLLFVFLGEVELQGPRADMKRWGDELDGEHDVKFTKNQ